MHFTRGLAAAALLAACAAGAHAAPATVTPVSSLHNTDADGIPLLATQQITVRGTVTSPDGIFSTTGGDIYIQDATGGVNVFSSPAPLGVALGDSIEATGYVKNFNGLCELDSTGVTIVLLGTASVTPAPLVLTCQGAMNTFQAGAPSSEPNEGRLIRINNVQLTGGTWPNPASASDVTLTLSDATGSLTLVIDKDTAVNGSPNPGGRFDVIGILKQFKSASPWTSGYEIVPRYANDVIPACTGPGIATLPAETAVSDQTVTVGWTTTTPSTGVLYYGTTTAYGNSATDGVLGTSHSVTIAGLAPRTLYHVQASATDAGGTCLSSDAVVITWPGPGTPGDIALYFNYSVDTSERRSFPAAQGNVNIQTQLINLINSATTSIDCALYSFSLTNVTSALIAAHNLRGVQVRLIQDAGNSTSQATQLQINGIPTITSTYGGLNHGGSAGGGIMHNKYVIVDAKAANKDLARVWTGSWNCSVSGTTDCNNTLIFRDYGMATAYTLDFDQMWGSSTLTPNAATSRMGSRKANIIPHLFQVGGVPVEVYMSPSDATESHLIQNIWQSQVSDQFCILDFTSDPLSHAMKVHRDSIPGYIVRGCFEPTQIASFSEWCKLDGQPSCSDYWIPRADVLQDGSTVFDLLHHKYMILDENYPHATVMTGSHNYSNAAKTVNDENTVIIHDASIANQFLQEFWARYRESGGQAVSVGPGHGVGGALELAQSQPNPSAGGTLIRYALPADAARATLAVYDLAGRCVRTLVDGPVLAGDHEARWDGMNDAGTRAGAGVYFYKLTDGRRTVARKLAFMR